MNRLAMRTLALLLAWSSPVRADYLSCQHPVMQGNNCVEVDITKQSWDASKLFHVAVSCVLCSGGSDINCGSAEMVTSAGQLSIMNASTLVKVPGSFSATGVTCPIGLPLYKFGSLLGPGRYLLLLKAGNLPEQQLFEFTVGPGGGPPSDSGVNPPAGDGGTTGRDGSGPVKYSETGVPIPASGDARLYDERGNPIAPGGGDDGCGCGLASRPRGAPLLGLLLLCGALALRRRGKERRYEGS